jgi:hypothetical protein
MFIATATTRRITVVAVSLFNMYKENRYKQSEQSDKVFLIHNVIIFNDDYNYVQTSMVMCVHYL